MALWNQGIRKDAGILQSMELLQSTKALTSTWSYLTSPSWHVGSMSPTLQGRKLRPRGVSVMGPEKKNHREQMAEKSKPTLWCVSRPGPPLTRGPVQAGKPVGLRRFRKEQIRRWQKRDKDSKVCYAAVQGKAGDVDSRWGETSPFRRRPLSWASAGRDLSHVGPACLPPCLGLPPWRQPKGCHGNRASKASLCHRVPVWLRTHCYISLTFSCLLGTINIMITTSQLLWILNKLIKIRLRTWQTAGHFYLIWPLGVAVELTSSPWGLLSPQPQNPHVADMPYIFLNEWMDI